MLTSKGFGSIFPTLKFALLIGILINAPQNVLCIVQGVTTTIAEHQHMVHLIFDKAPLCGGALVSPQWVVTAAHCVNHNGVNPARFKVRGGTTYLDGTAGVIQQVAKIIIHNKYTPKTRDNDFAMLKLAEPMTGVNIKPIELTSSALPQGAYVSVTGWGYMRAGSGIPSRQLRIVHLKTMTLAACRKHYPYLTNNMLCTEEPGKGLCSGDSGSPMVYKSTLVGVVSGAGCGRKNYPSMYANILLLRKFISDAMLNN